jgi:hypothetical protein
MHQVDPVILCKTSPEESDTSVTIFTAALTNKAKKKVNMYIYKNSQQKI